MRSPQLPPTLLYKLIDELPNTEYDSAIDLAKVKAIITDELSHLLNSQPTSILFDPQQYPLIETSVVNYGLGTSLGNLVSGQHAQGVETAIRTAILRFEPRIDPVSLVIALLTPTDDGTPAYHFRLTLSAQLVAFPASIPFTLSGIYDAESRRTLFDDSRRLP